MNGEIKKVEEYFKKKYLIKVPPISIKEVPTSVTLFYSDETTQIIISDKQINKGVVAHEITHYRYWPYSIYISLIKKAYTEDKFGEKATVLANVIDDIIVNLEMHRKDDFIKELAEYYKNNLNNPNPLMKVFLAFLSYKTGLDFGINKKELDSKLREKIEELNKIDWGIKDEMVNNGMRITYNAGRILEDLIEEDQIMSCTTTVVIKKEDIPKILKKIKRDYPEYYDTIKNYLKNKNYNLDLTEYIDELDKYHIKIVNNVKIKNGFQIKSIKKWDGVSEFDIVNSLGFIPGEIRGDPTIVQDIYKSTSVYSGYGDIPNAIIILDTSGSMPSNFPAPQIIASMLIAKEYVLNGKKVATVTFNDEGETRVKNFSNDLMDIYKEFVRVPTGCTHLDIEKLKDLMKNKKNIDTFLITDSPEGGWDNLVDTLDYLEELNRDNYVTIFWINQEIPEIAKKYSNLNLVLVKNIDDLIELVINRSRRY